MDLSGKLEEDTHHGREDERPSETLAAELASPTAKLKPEFHTEVVHDDDNNNEGDSSEVAARIGGLDCDGAKKRDNGLDDDGDETVELKRTKVIDNSAADFLLTSPIGEAEASNTNLGGELIEAAKTGALEDVKTLVGKGVPVDFYHDYDGWTPLIWACQLEQDEVVEWLVQEAGANVHAKTKNGLTALMASCMAGNEDMVELLLDHGASLHDKDIHGMTALIKVACSYQGALEVARILLERGANLHEKDGGQDTALMLACENDHIDLVEFFLEQGARLEDQNVYGETALFKSRASSQMARTLLQHGSSVNHQDYSGNTALMVTVNEGEPDVVQLLLQHGAQVQEKNDEGKTALMMSRTAEMAESLLKHGASVEDKDVDGWTCLHWAGYEGRFNVVRILCEHGANVHIKDNEGNSALHLACRESQIDAARLLLQLGARIMDRNQRGLTALEVACETGAGLDLIRLLVRSLYDHAAAY